MILGPFIEEEGVATFEKFRRCFSDVGMHK